MYTLHYGLITVLVLLSNHRPWWVQACITAKHKLNWDVERLQGWTFYPITGLDRWSHAHASQRSTSLIETYDNCRVGPFFGIKLHRLKLHAQRSTSLIETYNDCRVRPLFDIKLHRLKLHAQRSTRLRRMAITGLVHKNLYQTLAWSMYDSDSS